MKTKACKKCGANNFGTWVSSSTGKVNRYCRPCRRQRAKEYSDRKASTGKSHTKKQWLEKMVMFDACPMCKKLWNEITPRPDKRYKNVITKDHIVPLKKGGHDGIENLQPVCYRCNFSKCDGR